MTTNLEERAREFLRAHGYVEGWDEENIQQLADLLARVQAEARERLAAWMIEHSFATGHGDTLEDLLKELSWQMKELRQTARLAALEEAAQICVKLFNESYEEGRLALAIAMKRIRALATLGKESNAK